MRQTPRHHLVGPAIMAIALALPVAGALAETFDAVVVHTRSLNTNADGLGRAGGSAFVDNRDATLEAQQAQAGAAVWDKTKAEAASAWNRTKAFVAQKPAVPVDEPQRYGRAGGFIGAEQFEVPQPGVTELGSAPANSDAIKSGAVQWGYIGHATAAVSQDHGSTHSSTAPNRDTATSPAQN